MARAILRDDRPALHERERRVKVALDDDGCKPCSPAAPGVTIPPDPDTPTPPPTGGVNPVLTVRLRTRTGYSDDGNPMFEWRTVTVGTAIVWTQREEFDPAEGFTMVEATAMLAYGGNEVVTETASVTDDDGNVWRVVSVEQVPDRLGFTLQRIDPESS